MIYMFSCGFVLVVWAAIVFLNERHGILSADRFSSSGAKWFAYLWLAAFMLLLAYLVTVAALQSPTPEEIATTPFYQLFALHAILVVFLIGWWLASGRPALRQFLNIRHEQPLEVAAIGTAVGVGGWVITIFTAMMLALLLQSVGAVNTPTEPPAMIGWMANLSIWKKALIVLSAMTVEEAFFRSFLQKRIGLVASTILFSLAHFTYGNPLLLIGITVVSLIIGITFYRTRNVLPGVIAHGVFDAIQLFVIVPFAVRMMGVGS
ncbi:MAG TPA: type II CAAX endopeptidase family protein [Thermoanaerobaculia bacterium]